jgi:protein-disulfide isomerase
MSKSALFLAAALIGLLPFSSFAADAPAATPPQTTAATPPQAAAQALKFTDAQRAEIEGIIKEFLTEKHPEVLSQGLQNLQKREQEEADAKTKEKLVSEKDKLYKDPATPVGGNPKAKVSVVEFYDYQCSYCKLSEESVERLLKEDKDVKVLYKNYPILGPASVEAAKAGLASVKQGKFQAFHFGLMNKKDRLSSEMIYEVAKEVGLDVEKLKKDMADKSIDDALNASVKLGQDIGVRGTPMFIINTTVFPGVVPYDQMKNAVSEARSKEKAP